MMCVTRQVVSRVKTIDIVRHVRDWAIVALMSTLVTMAVIVTIAHSEFLIGIDTCVSLPICVRFTLFWHGERAAGVSCAAVLLQIYGHIVPYSEMKASLVDFCRCRTSAIKDIDMIAAEMTCTTPTQTKSVDQSSMNSV